MDEQERELKLSLYLEEWVNNHYGDWHAFYHDVVQNQRYGLNLLKDSGRLRDLLEQIMGTIEGKFSLPNNESHLIPTQFTSIPQLLTYLEWFRDLIDSFKPTIVKNIKGEVIDNDIIAGICDMVSQIDGVVERCISVYGGCSLPLPISN